MRFPTPSSIIGDSIMSKAITANEKQAAESGGPEKTYQSTFVPRFDIWEGDDELLLYGDLPGVSADDLDIRFENRELSIHGAVKPRHQGEFVYGEYDIGDFHRTFTVGEAIDAEKISAEMSNGVLTLRLPKSEKVKPRRIQVNAN
jgi:HSP20 family molecular chaperone IbpA